MLGHIIAGTPVQNAFDQAHAQAEQKFDDVKSAPSIPLFIDNQACLSVTNHPNNSTKSRHIALREFRIRDYHEHGIIRPYWCPGNYNVADFFSELLEKGLFTMHAYRFGMNFQV